jgi:hypothetical protein
VWAQGLVTVAPWTFSLQPTYTPRAGPCALRRDGITIRRGGPPPHAASTQKIMELRDQGLTWNEVARQVDMTVSGVWSRYRRAGG